MYSLKCLESIRIAYDEEKRFVGLEVSACNFARFHGRIGKINLGTQLIKLTLVRTENRLLEETAYLQQICLTFMLTIYFPDKQNIDNPKISSCSLYEAIHFQACIRCYDTAYLEMLRLVAEGQLYVYPK